MLLGNFRQPVQGRDKPGVIEGLSLFHHKKHLRRDHCPDEFLRIFFRMALPEQAIKGQTRFRRVVAGKLVLDDFEDRGVQIGIEVF